MADVSPFRHAKADDSAGFLLWKLTALWQEKLGLVFDRLGITQTQYAIMASLRWFEEGGEPTTQASSERRPYVGMHTKRMRGEP